MAVITVGYLEVEQRKPQANGEEFWVRGTVHLHPSCRSLLRSIDQRKLPFTVITGKPIPKKSVILLGDFSEYQFPDSGRVWKTFEIEKWLEPESSAISNLSCSFSEAIEKIARNDKAFLKELGSMELRMKKKLTKLLGTRNKFADYLLEQFELDAYQELVENPWKMIHIIPYFTIAHADAVAKKVGLSLENPKRFRELFRHLLDQSLESQRNTYLTENEFLALYWMHFSDTMSFEDYKQLAATEGSPIVKTELGYHPLHFYEAEEASFEVITQSLATRIPQVEGEAQITEQVILDSAIPLTDQQKHAIRQAFHSPLHILTGGPGTGKTTTLNSILAKLMILTGSSPEQEQSPFLLIAPTGKAAYRMWEQTGIMAHTAHSAFGIVPGYGCISVRKTAKRLSHVQYLIIDESSMLDTQLFGDICRVLQAMDHLPFLLLVGDADQLAPVQHGQVFLDILHYLQEHAPEQVTALTEVKRQANGSHIPELAAFLRKGTFPPLAWFQDKSDIFFVPNTLPDFPKTLVSNVLLPKKSELDTIQIVTPYRNGTTADTITAINQQVEPIYNQTPQYEEDPLLGIITKAPVATYPGKQFRVGDKVINRSNRSAQVVNGSIGIITRIQQPTSDDSDQSLLVNFNGVEEFYAYEEFRELELAYAITIHASQGSEYPNVILPILRGQANPDFLNRNLLYVGVTRASKKLVLMGSHQVFCQIAATPMKLRKTALAYWLQKGNME